MERAPITSATTKLANSLSIPWRPFYNSYKVLELSHIIIKLKHADMRKIMERAAGIFR